MKKINPVVHFEMPYVDKNRMADFYAKSFGWEYNMLGEDMGNYVVVMTSEEGPNKRPKDVGMINGGFYEKPKDEMGQCPSVVISVDDINESMKKIEQLGGKILGKPDDIPGVGLYVSFQDTEGNRASILQPSKEM
ncbi:MAG: Glyoxalase/bleomycin resistance protein/dioxygenase [Candidatus Moranbacteria bacterium GW2011_GWC2_37_73]|nr:MAG: glyoxalase/bleomycin resistance protein/dioxygenase [Parcubacteria group bacterium GW2011_GWC1_36_108]KKQ00599.1 MAG: Glyoxalase/bleomycin resistance protein/dioxygenase [Candidatus Moranbacteria bacterium GW2011_GWD1_36_198]KKQ02018.1 MAG: Glyoxalase/bleomycin resistance protein/dioxygenase [Candidatus Moranbacteria bacterium GW2011_GWD2_36_198]KKQ39875.1 MAG: Glyoxalase/bleomycin resistance protein/dioxygenase [Candidatus Moranbacteria bacterium GW2011_GWC2_37_73]